MTPVTEAFPAAAEIRGLGLHLVRLWLADNTKKTASLASRAERAYETEPMRSATQYLAAAHREVEAVYRRYLDGLPKETP